MPFRDSIDADHPIHEELRRHRRERAARFGRIRRWMRHLPRRSNIGDYPILKWFADAARSRPYLWTFRAPGPRRAIYLGAVLSLLPVYGLQILLAFVAAVVFRANLAITCALQAVTNPLTAAPIYYGTYWVGHFIIATLGLGEGYGPVSTRVNALVLGGLVCGLVLGFFLDLTGRFLTWEAEQLRRRHRLAHLEAERLHRQHRKQLAKSGSPVGEDPANDSSAT